jgi:hypothetical protein
MATHAGWREREGMSASIALPPEVTYGLKLIVGRFGNGCNQPIVDIPPIQEI